MSLPTWLGPSVASLSARRPQFYPRIVHVRSMVDKVALGQVFLPVIRFSFLSFISPMIHTHLHLHGCFYQKDKRAKPRNLPIKQCSFGNREHWLGKYFLFSPFLKGSTGMFRMTLYCTVEKELK